MQTSANHLPGNFRCCPPHYRYMLTLLPATRRFSLCPFFLLRTIKSVLERPRTVSRSAPPPARTAGGSQSRTMHLHSPNASDCDASSPAMPLLYPNPTSPTQSLLALPADSNPCLTPANLPTQSPRQLTYDPVPSPPLSDTPVSALSGALTGLAVDSILSPCGHILGVDGAGRPLKKRDCPACGCSTHKLPQITYMDTPHYGISERCVQPDSVYSVLYVTGQRWCVAQLLWNPNYASVLISARGGHVRIHPRSVKFRQVLVTASPAISRASVDV